MAKVSFYVFAQFTLWVLLSEESGFEAIHISESAGGHVIAVMSDNHPTNRNTHSAFLKKYPIPDCDSSFKVVHPEDFTRCLYPLLNSVHLLKSTTETLMH